MGDLSVANTGHVTSPGDLRKALRIIENEKILGALSSILCFEPKLAFTIFVFSVAGALDIAAQYTMGFPAL